MTDLTKLTTPYGLLDDATREALKAHGGPYEMYDERGWRDISNPRFAGGNTYRVKPSPPKPREWWVNVYPDRMGDTAYRSPEDADKHTHGRSHIIHVREVT